MPSFGVLTMTRSLSSIPTWRRRTQYSQVAVMNGSGCISDLNPSIDVYGDQLLGRTGLQRPRNLWRRTLDDDHTRFACALLEGARDDARPFVARSPLHLIADFPHACPPHDRLVQLKMSERNICMLSVSIGLIS